MRENIEAAEILLTALLANPVKDRDWNIVGYARDLLRAQIAETKPVQSKVTCECGDHIDTVNDSYLRVNGKYYCKICRPHL